MERYFNIRYEFDIPTIHESIARQVELGEPGYICVADGNVLNMVNRKNFYKEVIDGSIFSICDSSWVPIFIRWIYGYERQYYCGNDIFTEIVNSRKYKMAFLGTKQRILDGLKANLVEIDPKIADMLFYELPFCNVDDFDYAGIADMINKNDADIIWIALGAPKQEIFMSKLKPHLKRGVIISVGAVFKFNCGLPDIPKRSPEWLRKHHLEFLHRIFKEPKKQIKRCWGIVVTLPRILNHEWRLTNKKK